jgi:hypothetical protein
MSEVDETSQRMRQLMMTMFSAALAAAQAAQMLRAHRAREATRAAAAEQAQLRRQLQADRAGAAVLWRRAMDPRLASTHPEQLAQAWSSAVAWETLDARAAATARRMDQRLRAAGVHPEIVRAARESDDYAALALLLAHGEEQSAGAGGGPQREQRPDYEELLEELHEHESGQLLDTAAIIEQALDPETAASVLGAAALPALETELARATARGHDPVEILSRVAAQRSLEDADDPAAVLHYRLHRDLNLEPDPTENLAEDGEDAWWLLDEAARDETTAAHDRADADAERWAGHAAGTVAADPLEDPVTRAAAESAAEGHSAAAAHLDHSASALATQAQDATAAASAAAGSPAGFTGGSATAQLAAESFSDSIHTGLVRSGSIRPAPQDRARRIGRHAEADRERSLQGTQSGSDKGGESW